MKQTGRILSILTLLISLFSAAIAADESLSRELLQKMDRGDWQEARESLESIQSRTPLQTRLLMELYDRRGETEPSESLARSLLREYRNGLHADARTAYNVAYAAWRLQRWEEANRIFIELSASGSAPLSLYVDWGNLYLEKYNPAEAASIFQDGLEQEAGIYDRWGTEHLYLGISRALSDQGAPGAGGAMEKALEADPEDPYLAARQAHMALQEEDWEEADSKIEEGLDRVSDFLPLLELQAAIAYFEDEPERFQERLGEVKEINPRPDDLYELLGDLCVMRRRLEDAINHYDQALKLAPDNWSALSSKGINLLRQGRETEGIAALERAYENDPYNIWTVNTLRLVDSFERFERSETPHFLIKLHRDEAPVLAPYVEPLLERSLTTIEERYGHEVDHRVVFEMYPDHEDFAVRTLGLPGLGALGATFGRIVAMDSPQARERGEFHWASTLWHEVAHVVTLSLSQGRVPRWLTEGISMMEERTGGRGWGDPLSIAFVRAYEADKLLPLSDLNSGFIRPDSPEQISLSYFQAGWVCEVMGQEFGIEKMREMLIAYGEGLETDQVFEQVLGRSVEEVDEIFRAELKEQLDPLLPKLSRPDNLSADTESLRAELESNPDNYFLNWVVGSRLAEKEEFESAIPYLERAIEIFPSEAGKESPYVPLARAYRELGREEEELELLERWWIQAPRTSERGRRLAQLLRAEGRLDEAIQVLQEVMYSDPLSPEVHADLGENYFASRDFAGAVREFRVLLALDPVDRADVHFRLARALHRLGENEAARQQVLLALEIAPGFEEAQELLLEVVRQ